MREAIFIIFVILLLLGLTALRYRKQIAGLIGLAKMLQDVKNSAGSIGREKRGKGPSLQLVNCSQCGVWVPANKIISNRVGSAVCAKCG